MLFDLRGRGRRRTVQAVYLGLALLLGGGLVLFGVGAGNGNGGILNAFTGNGSGGSQKQVVSQAEKAALRQTQQNPNAPMGWAGLVQARWTSAGQGSDFNVSTGTFTAAGRRELTAATQAWQRYLPLIHRVEPAIAILAARSYAALGDYSGAAGAWEQETLVTPGESKGFQCLAATAYAAKQTHKGDLAAAQAVNLAPKATRLTLGQALQQAKANPQVAQSC